MYKHQSHEMVQGRLSQLGTGAPARQQAGRSTLKLLQGLFSMRERGQALLEEAKSCIN